MIDPQFWQDEPVVFSEAPADAVYDDIDTWEQVPHSDRDGSEEPGLDHLADQHTEEIIASLADPDYARQWLAHNDELHELLYQQRRAADRKLAKVHVLAAMWKHQMLPAPSFADELLEALK